MANKCPNGVLKSVFHLCPSLIWTRLFALPRYITEGFKEAIVEGKRILVSDGDDIQSTVINARA